MPKPNEIVLEPTERGPLCIWEHPEPGRKYVLGVDTANGLAKGDSAVGVVIEAETTTVVARWSEKADPHIFGVRMALLGWYYNEAILAIETFPSAHGVTACNEAIRAGYRNIYRKTTTNRFTKQTTDVLGWATNVQTKPMLIDRIKRALLDGTAYIHDEELLQEIRTRIWDAKGQMAGPGHDDILIAYGIALMVRDESWRLGKLRADPDAEDWRPHIRYWKEWEKKNSKPVRKGPPRLRGLGAPWKLHHP